MNAKPCKPEAMPWLCPYLVVRDVETAMSFYADVFGMRKGMVYGEPDGKPFYGEMWHENASVLVGLPRSGKTHVPKRDTAATLYAYTPDVDALAQQAASAGAEVLQPPADQFWGDRTCLLCDPDGHAWMWATHQRDIDLPRAGREG